MIHESPGSNISKHCIGNCVWLRNNSLLNGTRGKVEAKFVWRRLLHIPEKSPWWPGPGSSCGKGEKWLQCLKRRFISTGSGVNQMQGMQERDKPDDSKVLWAEQWNLLN